MCAETGEGGDSGRCLNPPHVCGQSSPMVKDCSFGEVREGKGGGGHGGGGGGGVGPRFDRARIWSEKNMAFNFV